MRKTLIPSGKGIPVKMAGLRVPYRKGRTGNKERSEKNKPSGAGNYIGFSTTRGGITKKTLGTGTFVRKKISRLVFSRKPAGVEKEDKDVSDLEGNDWKMGPTDFGE